MRKWDPIAKETRVLDCPCSCEACEEDDKRHFGCGEWAGKGTHGEGWDNELFDPWVKATCPRWCRDLPEVQRVLIDREDWERGAFGNILDLDAPFVRLMQAASLEHRVWDAEMDRQSKR